MRLEFEVARFGNNL